MLKPRNRSSASLSSRRLAGRVLTTAVLVAALGACGSSSSKSDTKTTDSKASTPSNGPIKLTKITIRKLQVDLDKVNCNVGADDGIFGPETFAGLQAFKQAEAMSLPTVFNEATRLKLEAAVAAGAPVCPDAPPPTTSSTQAAGNPPCTVAALQAALPADQAPAGTVDPSAFQCSGAYAVASVDLAPPASITITNLFIASGNSWVSIDRVQPCAAGSGNPIPAEIFQQACNTN